LEKASWTTPLLLDGHSENDLSLHNLTFEDAIEMALDKPLWGVTIGSKRSYALMVHAE